MIMKTCNKCGAENPNKNKFCGTCGAVFDSEEVKTAATEPEEGKAEPMSGTPDPDRFVKPVNSPDSGSYSYDNKAYTPPVKDNADYGTVAVLSLILGIVGFFINPFYTVSIAGFILGVIGCVNSVNYKTLATFGMIVSITSFVMQVIVDLFCTLGFGIFC